MQTHNGADSKVETDPFECVELCMGEILQGLTNSHPETLTQMRKSFWDPDKQELHIWICNELPEKHVIENMFHSDLVFKIGKMEKSMYM